MREICMSGSMSGIDRRPIEFWRLLLFRPLHIRGKVPPRFLEIPVERNATRNTIKNEAPRSDICGGRRSPPRHRWRLSQMRYDASARNGQVLRAARRDGRLHNCLFFDGRYPRRAWPVLAECIRPNV
jgi:hypothetical protein